MRKVVGVVVGVAVTTVLVSGCSSNPPPSVEPAPVSAAPAPAVTVTVTAPPSSSPATPSEPQDEQPTTAQPAAAPPSAQAPRRAGDHVTDEPANLFCRDLKALGYSYAESTAYWAYYGLPPRMDVDHNGIPCETVFPNSEIDTFFRTVFHGRLDLPAGLYCRDILAMGGSFGEAMTYWVVEGRPSRMDVDRNGIPCETVYSRQEVTDFYGG